MLEIQDAHEKALKYFNRIIDAFEEQNINPTPLNYYIWYQYFKGEHPQFRQEMDSVLNDPFGYHDRIGRRMYHTYFSDQDIEDSLGFDKALKRLLEVMAKRIQHWGDKLEQQTERLENCAERLSGDLEQHEVKRITSDVLNTANSMQESSRSFTKEMLENADEIQKLRKQLVDAKAEAMKDELTQIGNRKAFNLSLKEFTDDIINGENTQNLYLVLSDIDHFKSFNDTYGHLIGDSILRYYSNILKRNQIENQITCRYGGEEFALLIKADNLETAIEVAENCRKEIEAAHLKRKDSKEALRTVTASFGIAQFKMNEEPESFVKRADDALYHAKKTGRNRIVTEIDLESLR